MAKCSVALKTSARKELEGLSAKSIERIVPHLDNLADNPRPHGYRKLKGGDNEWRIRIGDYRVVYIIDDAKAAVEVTRVRHRSEAYQS